MHVVIQIGFHAKRFATGLADMRPLPHVLRAHVAFQAGCVGKHPVAAVARDGPASPFLVHSLDVSLPIELAGENSTTEITDEFIC